MAGIIFPTGMKNTEVNDDSIFMIYEEGTSDGKPRTIKAKNLLRYLTGSVSPGNEKFPTGDAISELLEHTINADESLSDNLAQFNSLGTLSSGGSFSDFTNSFNKIFNVSEQDFSANR